MKLLVTRRMTERAEAALRARFDTTLLDRTQGLTPAEAAQAMRDHDAVMPTLGDRFSAEAFSQGLRCRLLANFGAGYNHIDVAAAAAAGIAVTNTPDVLDDCVADLAIGLTIDVMRAISASDRNARQGLSLLHI